MKKEEKAVCQEVKMGRIIAIANQKGGVGKTTTAINLSASLASMDKKVLALDMDPQGNMTSGLGVDKDGVDKTVYDLIIGNAGIEECLCRDVLENLDVLPSNINLSAAEIELIGVDNKEFILRDEVKKVKDRYDFVIIDCPPALSMLTINAMTMMIMDRNWCSWPISTESHTMVYRSISTKPGWVISMPYYRQ